MKITVIDDSSYSVPSVRVVDVEQCSENIAGLKSDIEGLQKQIDAKLSQIAEYQAEIDAGADAGVQKASLIKTRDDVDAQINKIEVQTEMNP